MNWLIKLSISIGICIIPISQSSAQPEKHEKRAYRFLNEYYHHFGIENKLSIKTLAKAETIDRIDKMLSFSFLIRKPPFSQKEPAVPISSLIDEEDIKSMKEQLYAWKDVQFLDPHKLKCIRKSLLIQDNRTKEERFFPSFSTHKIYFPLFNLEGDVALIYYEIDCGLQCGSGELEILKMQKNGKWESVRIILAWIA